MLREHTVHNRAGGPRARRPLGRVLGLSLALALVSLPGLAREQHASRAPQPEGRARSQKRIARSYEVSSGDTLGGIALRFHVSVEDLCRENGLSEKQVLRAGRTLRLPSSAAAEPTPPPEAKSDGKPAKVAAPSTKTSARAPVKKPSALAPAVSAKATADKLATAKAGADKPALTKPSSPKAAEKPSSKKVAESAPPELAAPARGGSLPEVKSRALATKPAAESSSLAKVAAEDSSVLGVPTLDKRALARTKTGPSWLAYSARPKKRGYLELHSTVGRWSGQAVVDGWTIPEEARVGITRTLASWRSGAQERIHGRLIRLLARVSDQFGGRPIRIVSGFRPHDEARYTPHSKHTLGRAVDFSIPGIPNEVLRDYLRQNFQDVGIGYYPNSTHVHLDIREENVYWVDYSSPGQAPSYGHPPRPRAAAASPARNGLSQALDSALVSSLSAIGHATPTTPTKAPAASPSVAPQTAPAAVAEQPPASTEPPAAASANAAQPSAAVPAPAPAASAKRDAASVAASSADSPSAHDTHSPEDP